MDEDWALGEEEREEGVDVRWMAWRRGWGVCVGLRAGEVVEGREREGS